MTTSSLYCPSCGALNTHHHRTCFACSHPLDEPVHDLLLHNRYRLIEQVGKGGFGAVHKAEDTQEQNAIVAIKQINLRGLTPQQVIEATDGFNREVSLLSSLSNPHLPHIYEHFTDPDHWYLVMDFIEGETLETYLEKTYVKRGELTPLPLHEVLDIGLQLCSVLDYLHTREPAIIFRDLKPANIMRSSTGTLYLIDFGIARHFKPGKPKDTIPFGSPGYAAPEQYGKAQTTPRSDLYSLGALLHMLLSGNDPVDSPFHFDPLRIYGDAGVSELTLLIERMVALDSQQRPQSAHIVQEELQHIIDLQQPVQSLPIGAPPPPSPVIQPVDSNGGLGQRMQQVMVQRQQLRKQRQQYWSFNRRKSRRKFVITTAAIVGGVTLTGGLVSGLLEIGLSHRGASNGLGDVSIGPGPEASPLFQQSIPLNSPFADGFPIRAVTWSRDGKRVALSSQDTVCVVLINPDTITSSRTGTAGRIQAVQSGQEFILTLSWRPKIADSIAFASDTALSLWTGEWSGIPGSPEPPVIHHFPTQQGSQGAFAWSPDGESIAVPFKDGIRIWSVKSRTFVKQLRFDYTHLPAKDSTTLLSLAWSPDGKYIAARLGNDSPLFCRVSDGAMFLLNTRKPLIADVFAWSPNSQFLALAQGPRVYVIDLTHALMLDPQQLTVTNGPYPDVAVYEGHQANVTAISWSPDGRYIASGDIGLHTNLHVWTPFTAADAPASENPTTIVNNAPGSHDDDFLFRTTLTGNNTGIQSLAWSPDGNNLVVGTGLPYIVSLNTRIINW